MNAGKLKAMQMAIKQGVVCGQERRDLYGQEFQERFGTPLHVDTELRGRANFIVWFYPYGRTLEVKVTVDNGNAVAAELSTIKVPN